MLWIRYMAVDSLLIIYGRVDHFTERAGIVCR